MERPKHATWTLRVLVFLFSFLLSDQPFAASLAAIDVFGQSPGNLLLSALLSPFWIPSSKQLWLLVLVPAVILLLGALEERLPTWRVVVVVWGGAILGSLVGSAIAHGLQLPASHVDGGIALAAVICGASVGLSRQAFQLGAWRAQSVLSWHVAAGIAGLGLALLAMELPAYANALAFVSSFGLGLLGTKLLSRSSFDPVKASAKKNAGHLRVVRSVDDLLH